MAVSTLQHSPQHIYSFSLLARLWDKLTEPAAEVKDIQARRNARLTASLLLVLIPLVAAVLMTTQFVTMGGLSPDQYIRTTVVRWLLEVVVIGAYFFARGRRPTIGALLMVASMWLIAYSGQYLIVNNPVGWGAQILILAILIVVASMVFSLRATLLISLLMMAAEVPVPFLSPSPSHSMGTLATALLILAMGTTLTLVSMRHRDGVEQDRRAQLLTINAALEDAVKKANEANRLKSEFLATMSHELRTPLHAIIGYADVQLTGMTGPLTEEQAEYQNRILVNADHLLKLIDDVLDIAKIEAGRMDIVRKPFAVRDVLHEIVDMSRSLADQKGLTYEVVLDEHFPEKLVGDPDRVKQIALNLISNAIKFTAQGSVRVDVVCRGKNVWALVVSDTGIGIPPHALEYIFDEFRQVDGSTSREFGGTGLGLAIVRKLALLMGGNVRAESQVGKGSTFTVLLPLVASEG